MLRNLQKKHEPLYALSGFGPGFLNLFLAIYIENALNGSAGVISYNPDDPKAVIIIVSIYTILLVIGRVIDALLNIPMAAVSDNFKTK
jgi:Na+/melibiose symporter-like transporter